MKRKCKKVVLGLLAHVTPSICFGRILRSEALVYNSYIFFRTAVLRKLFDNRFSYKHCNFSRVCLLVKMGSKTPFKVFCLDIIENFHLILNNYCFFRITVEYVKLTLRPTQDGASSDHTQQ